MSAMTTSMRGLKQAAESGSFAISKDGAEAYIKAIEDAQKELRQVERYGIQLTQETKLGTSPDAQAMSRYNMESANGGAGTTGILPALDQLKMALEDAKLAVKKAIENYDQVDGSAASGLKRY